MDIQAQTLKELADLRAKYTMAQLAEMLGISRPTLYMWFSIPDAIRLGEVSKIKKIHDEVIGK